MKISPDHDHEVEGEIEEIETNFDVNIKVVSENKSNSSQIKDQKHEIMVGVEDPKDVEGSEMEAYSETATELIQMIQGNNIMITAKEVVIM